MFACLHPIAYSFLNIEPGQSRSKGSHSGVSVSVGGPLTGSHSFNVFLLMYSEVLETLAFLLPWLSVLSSGNAGDCGQVHLSGFGNGAVSLPTQEHHSWQRFFIAIKPDGVQRGLVGEIIKRFEQKGFRLVAMKFLRASEEHLKQHYIDLKDRPFFPGLVKYMNSGPVVAMVWEGLNVVKTGRMMLGETNPADSKPGTIRGDFCIQVGRNIIHGSDSVQSAQKEISLWFKSEELVDYKSCAHDWVYE